MYARGMTVRGIRGHLEELYGIEVSPDLISAITDAVIGRSRRMAEPANAFDICYPLVFFDAIRVKSPRLKASCATEAIYIALSKSLPDGARRFSASGSSRPKAPNSGCASSTS